MTSLDAEKLKEQGNEFFKTGEYETAIRYYSNAIKTDGTQSVYYSNRARCHKMIERFKEGLEDAQRAIELDTKNIKAHLLMGECLCMLAKREKEYTKIDTAITRMTKALSLCASQEMRKFELDITVCIRKAKKLRWMIAVRESEKTRLGLEARLEQEFKKAPDQAVAAENLKKLKELLKPKADFRKSDIPAYFICPLTETLFIDPVVNEFGYSYERKNYTSFVASKQKDPTTGSPISKNIMYDNITLRAGIEEFLEENIWAFDFTEGQTVDTIAF